MPFAKLLVRPLIRASSRGFFRSAPTRSSAYDADGKTSVTILNQEAGMGLMIDTYSQMGFRLNNGAFVFGPIAIFPKTVLSWNVQGDSDIHADSLELFTILEPRPDVLIVGYSEHQEHFKRKLDKLLLEFRVSKKLNMEILPTDRAVSTFNFLNAENRYVAAALIPPKVVNCAEDDLVRRMIKRKELYEYHD